MRRLVTTTLALVLLGPALWALDDTKDKAKKDKRATPEQAYQTIIKEYQNAQQEFFKAIREAKTDEERTKAIAKSPKREEYASRMMTLATEHPKNSAAEKALIWVVQNAGYSPDGAEALDILLKDHIKSKDLGPALQSLEYSSAENGERFLREVLEKNPHKDVRGQACFSLARHLKNKAERTPTDEKTAKEAENFFVLVTEKYKDAKHGSSTLGKAAEPELYELRHLWIGKPAPEIKGTDVDGKKFKLSDYIGKVVVLDFWGNW
jgi:AhpC/TSA family